jgi:hypothetical protein
MHAWDGFNRESILKTHWKKGKGNKDIGNQGPFTNWHKCEAKTTSPDYVPYPNQFVVEDAMEGPTIYLIPISFLSHLYR